MMSDVEVLLKRCFWLVLVFTKAKKHRLFLRPERRWNSMTTMIVFCGCPGSSAAENFPDAEFMLLVRFSIVFFDISGDFTASFMITSASWFHIMRLFDQNLYHLYSFVTYCTFLQHQRQRAFDCVIAAEASRPRSGFVVSTCGFRWLLNVCFLI